MDPSIKPFTVAVPDDKLASLKVKLEAADLPAEVPMSDSWDYGVPVSDMQRLVKYWINGFDWRKQEAEINKLPQFTTPIDVDGFGSLDVHFVYKKSSRKGAIPLLFCHGWPGSYLEVAKVLPLLTEPDGDSPAFDVIAPSLPNFGFSQAPSKPGFRIYQYAETLHKLMLKLGYTQYVTQGGDWGFTVTRWIGILYPHACLASHWNYCLPRAPTLFKHPILYLRSLLPLTARERAGFARTRWFLTRGYGYNMEQTTRPATIGLALAASPVATLAWIYEKLHDWTDNYPWTDDEILAWVSVYWFSAGGVEASARIYYETQTPARDPKSYEYIPGVKLGISSFPQDLMVQPSCYQRTLGPVVFERFHTEGGHFAAHEKPKLLVGDLREMFGKGGGAESVSKVWTG